MRLALVIYGSLHTLSGGYLYDRRVVEHLRAAGDTVEVVSLAWRNYARHLLDNFDSAVYQQIAALKVDLLVQDELNHPSLLRANRQWKINGGTKIVSIVHHLRSSELHPAPLLPLYRAVERGYLRGVDGFVFNSRTTRAAVERLLGHAAPGVVAYPAGDQIGGGLAMDEIHKRFQVSLSGGHPLRLVFIGNLIARKGLHTLLEALRQMGGEDWSLDIVGGAVDQEYSCDMQRLAAPLGPRVRFHGRLVDGALRKLLAESDVLAVPSSYEGFGIVYLEGMACGLPAIGSTAGAAGEIIRDQESGFLTPPEEPLSLVEVLRALITNREMLARMSLSARRRFDDFPTWEQSAETVRQYLLSLLEGEV